MQTQKSYIGERHDPETGLLYLNARYMDPVLGRFISPDILDPNKTGVGTNRYAYSHNDPINNTDTSGHCENEPTCVGKFSETFLMITGPQTNDGVQDYFNFRTDPNIRDTYVADPTRFGIESQIDVGTQTQDRIRNPEGRARPYYEAAISGGGPANL